MSYLEILVTAIDWRREEQQPAPQLRIVEDDLENEVELAQPETTPVTTFPIAINVADIREYYPRRNGKVGTRIVFKNGAARPVMELFEEIHTKIVTAQATMFG